MLHASVLQLPAINLGCRARAVKEGDEQETRFSAEMARGMCQNGTLMIEWPSVHQHRQRDASDVYSPGGVGHSGEADLPLRRPLVLRATV
jgi:hypothetical protein